MPVSLPNTGVSIRPGGMSLVPATLDIPAQGVSMLIGVNSSTSAPPGTPGSLQFNTAANSQYVPLFAGFP